MRFLFEDVVDVVSQKSASSEYSKGVTLTKDCGTMGIKIGLEMTIGLFFFSLVGEKKRFGVDFGAGYPG